MKECILSNQDRRKFVSIFYSGRVCKVLNVHGPCGAFVLWLKEMYLPLKRFRITSMVRNKYDKREFWEGKAFFPEMRKIMVLSGIPEVVGEERRCM